ncbi:MAG: hypothetical protein ABJF23_12460, partial [Bryobacteraceae bacterium]
MNPPLSYSLPAWNPDGYANHRVWIDELKSLGFSWLTFTPTYLVYDRHPMRIDVSRGPAMAQLAEAVEYAAERGFHIRMEPHLDFETTLTGGPYEWRRRMYFSPLGQYQDEVVQPLLTMLRAAAKPGTRLEFTLGSELDVSLVEFSADWAKLIVKGGISMGHKINHDSLEPNSPVRDALSAVRLRRGLPAAGRSEYRAMVRTLMLYLAQLDYVAFSFYPAVRGPAANQFAAEFGKRASELAAKLPAGPGFAIGEFGLGSADVSRPYQSDAAALLNVPGAIDLREQYYLGFLEFLRRSGGLTGGRPSAFWTVTHFDFLGTLQWPGNEPFRDDRLRQAI